MRLVLETDAPYPDANAPPGPNPTERAVLSAFVAKQLASLRGLTEDEVAAITSGMRSVCCVFTD